EQDNRPAGAGIGAMRRRALALLALLATAPEQGLSRDKLLPVLWPESDEGKERHVLAQLLYLLRRSLRSDDVILDTGALRLNPDAMHTDVADFHAALSRGDAERAAANHAAAASWWRRVAAMDPLSSRATVALMRALVAAGDRAAALQQGRVHE